MERIIGKFLENTLQHGYNEVSITFTLPTSVTNLRSFEAHGTLCGEAVELSEAGSGWQHGGALAGCRISQAPAACESRWNYLVDTSNGARSQISLSSSTRFVLRRNDIQSRAALIGLSHILHDDLYEVIAATTRPDPQLLSAREIDTLRWTAEGKTAAEIAQIIGISRRTVESYISNAMKKLGTSTRSAAAVKAYGLGLLVLQGAKAAHKASRPGRRTGGVHRDEIRFAHGITTGGS